MLAMVRWNVKLNFNPILPNMKTAKHYVYIMNIYLMCTQVGVESLFSTGEYLLIWIVVYTGPFSYQIFRA